MVKSVESMLAQTLVQSLEDKTAANANFEIIKEIPIQVALDTIS
jgi:hypothetical protein